MKVIKFPSSERGQASLLAFIVIGIVACGVVAAILYLKQMGNGNPQSSYVPNKGDCVVLPQGQDPVYDQFYAEHVNPNNCNAFKVQSEAHVNDANARSINEQTNQDKVGFFVSMAAFGSVGLGLLILAVIMGAKKT